MLTQVPVEIVWLLLQHLKDDADIYRLRRVCKKLNASTLQNTSFVSIRLKQQILQLSDNIEKLVDFNDISQIDSKVQVDLLTVLNMTKELKISTLNKSLQCITALQSLQTPLHSLSEILSLVIVRIHLNSQLVSSISRDCVMRNIGWAQQWYQKTQSVDSQFTLAAYWLRDLESRTKASLAVPATISNDSEDEFEDCGSEIAKENYSLYIVKALNTVSPELFLKVQQDEALLRAFANPFTRKIVNYCHNNGLSVENLLSLGEKNIAVVCNSGSIALLNQLLPQHPVQVHTKRTFSIYQLS